MFKFQKTIEHKNQRNNCKRCPWDPNNVPLVFNVNKSTQPDICFVVMNIVYKFHNIWSWKTKMKERQLILGRIKHRQG